MLKGYPRFVPITGTKFVRDMENGAILNTDINELNLYNTQKKIREDEKKEKEIMKTKICELEDSVNEIKEMLRLLVREKTNAN